MISLFLDTSSKKLNIFLVKDNEILFNEELETKNDHATYVVPLIEKALKDNDIVTKDINRIYVVVGPGSFTGTRIGVTVGKTIAFSNNIPVIPVSALKQYIFNSEEEDYYVSVISEKNDKLYYGIYDKNYNEVIEDKYSNKEELLNEINKLNGSYKIVPHDRLNIVKLMDYYSDKGVNYHLLKPNYLKKIEIEEKL